MAEADPNKLDQKLPTKIPEYAIEDDSDPDFDDLDDVLDQFSANAPQTTIHSQTETVSKPGPAASGPGRPDIRTVGPSVPHGQSSIETDEEFMARLTAEMQNVMSSMATDPAASAATPEDIAKMGKQLEEFTLNMEAQGVKPEDLLKAILGEETGRRVSDAALDEADRRATLSDTYDGGSSKSVPSTSAHPKDSKAPVGSTAFEESIKRAMDRMQTSESTAKDASSQPGPSETDLMSQLLQAMEAETVNSDPNSDNLSNMFLSMMDTLTHKDMLYEPMKKLDSEFPSYLEKNRSKISSEDMTRYKSQQKIVKQLVAKFEETGYSDEDSRCREYIWERMQQMQELGSPPEDLLGAPMPGLPNLPGLGGASGQDAGCPTQ